MSQQKRNHHRVLPPPQIRAEASQQQKTPPQCAALQNNGSECNRTPSKPGYDFCREHFNEKTRLYAEYKKAQAAFEAGRVPDKTKAEPGRQDMEQRVQLGDKVVRLRDQVNRRFFSKGTENNRTHIQQILKVKSEVDDLKRDLSVLEEKSAPGDDVDHLIETAASATLDDTSGEPEEVQVVYRSLLSPEVPLSKLNHLPQNHPVVVLRRCLDDSINSLVNKIYQIFPSLNDSSPLLYDPEENQVREPDKGDLVLRNVFREYVAWTGDTDVVAMAEKKGTIDAFLRSSLIDSLEDYAAFLEAFHAGEDYTYRFLRNAVYDCLLPQDAPHMAIMGGRITLGTNPPNLGIDGWDILYQYFSNLVTWVDLERYGADYEDIVLVKKLASLMRYPSWYQPEKDKSQECRPAVLQGFIAEATGDFGQKGKLAYRADGAVTERCGRDYLSGRMSRKNPLARRLIDELASRVVRLFLIVYDRQTGDCIARPDDMGGDWLTRSRTAPNENQLPNSRWEVDWSLEDLLRQLDLVRKLRDGVMHGDYYEFIIIRRRQGPKFDLLDCVAEALMDVSGTFNGQDVIIKAVQETFPAPSPTDDWLNELLKQNAPAVSPFQHIPRLDYEGSRSRAWDVVRNQPDIFASVKSPRKWDSRDAKVLSKILSSMEAAGVITQMTKYEPPQAAVKLLRATDGHEDVYFDYSGLLQGTRSSVGNFWNNATLELYGKGLRKFAESFKLANPDAVFAKGVIHPHYCAWPFPDMGAVPRLADLNFCTPDGHLYRWRQLPFDFPASFEMWQFMLHCEINSKLPFVQATQTTFIVCAATAAEAEDNAEMLLKVANKKGWRLSFPLPNRWTSDLEELDVEFLWCGIRPLAACLAR